MNRESLRGNADSTADPLGALAVIDRLEVGPAVVEKSRIRTPYRIVQGGKVGSMELIYRYGEEVFIPDEPASRNLADIVTAQVALNYGLFCDEILFRGGFDRPDQQFIRDMARNTAREIYVKKFLEPNPFLTEPVLGLPAVKRDSYLRAKISFERTGGGADGSPTDPSTSPWPVDSMRHAVSASGGKDSLLSFGLLREMGYEVHPIFVNESGRHWFTALNAYRFFARDVPRTARVWTNADRIFNGMLKHLSFIRRDFSRIRFDDYPIRLWTVAVFLFGVLPLMRKRGIGRLVVGDEFDTTRRLTHEGISHYDGLYDQSRYFDNTLTRYYHRKGWGVSQFSILRPLSELLIERILYERYPELQQHQVSCHAAHREGNRIHPCGRCEKCRRIVGLLMAIDADPRHCGYSTEQINECMKRLAAKGVHQDQADAEHLGFVLKSKGLGQGRVGSIVARERPELVKLRFDPDKSPEDGIPVDLRKPLYSLLLEYASGAVKRRGRTWIDVDPLTDPAANRPYPFEHPRRKASGVSRTPQKRSHVLGDLTWPEALTRFKEVDVAILPVGAIEQHGPHLPLDSDAFDAEYLAHEVAKACQDPKPVVLPLVPYGVSYHHEDFSGTISVGPETLSRLVYDIGMSAVRHGVTKLIIINGHGGNSPALHFAAQMINRDAHVFTCVDTGETSDPDIHAITETPNDVHAGEIETSTTLASRPHLVQLRAAKAFVPQFSSRYLDFTSKRSVGWYAHTSKISPTGVLGDPTKGDEEKGKKIWELMIRRLVEFVEDLKRMSLDEIYQRRY